MAELLLYLSNHTLHFTLLERPGPTSDSNLTLSEDQGQPLLIVGPWYTREILLAFCEFSRKSESQWWHLTQVLLWPTII